MSSNMGGPDTGRNLLAVDAGIRETGWAVFRTGNLAATGVIAAPRGRVDAKVRVAHLIECLTNLATEWQPGAVAYSEPSGLHWPLPALELLDNALVNWSQQQRLSLYGYSAQEIRLAIAGHPNAPRDQLGYAIMARFGLIGLDKTTHEWEAIAVGAYHLSHL